MPPEPEQTPRDPAEPEPSRAPESDRIELQLDALRHDIDAGKAELDEIIRSARERARRLGAPTELPDG